MVDILIKPIVTEKMNLLSDKFGRYGFKVDKRANKPEIKKAIEDIYGVKVTSINTMVYAGKMKSRFTKGGVISGRANAYKKAIVTLSKGENIDFYSNI
jgi:large subunit ribosomal protein L23